MKFRHLIRVLLVSVLLAAGFAMGHLASATEPSTQNTAPVTNGVGMKLVHIAPGEFIMGSPASEKGRMDDESQYKVKLTHGFYMASTPVTQEQWTAVMGSAHAKQFDGKNLPVVQISFDEASAYVKKLSEKEGKHYRLPTEAEWEYACRAGTTTSYYTGEGKDALQEAGWFDSNSELSAKPVGLKKPNAWGLYDMHGNVWQWCSDFYDNYPKTDVTDPTGPDKAEGRILRGGSWSDGPSICRSAMRNQKTPTDHDINTGLRVVMDE